MVVLNKTEGVPFCWVEKGGGLKNVNKNTSPLVAIGKGHLYHLSGNGSRQGGFAEGSRLLNPPVSFHDCCREV